MGEVTEQLSLDNMIPLGMELYSILSHVLVLLDGLHQAILLSNCLVDYGRTCWGANRQFRTIQTMLLLVCSWVSFNRPLWIRETYTQRERCIFVDIVQSLYKVGEL